MQLYNTLSRTIEEFQPIDPENVRMYTCGPTVYREVHIGNFRTYLTTDILARVLAYNGYKITAVMNITDVGHMRYSTEFNRVIDPVIQEASSRKMIPIELSQFYAKLFLADSRKLNITPSDRYPLATEPIPEMIEIIKILLKKGIAYQSEGNVYFNVRKFNEYGKLSGNTLNKMDQLLEAVRVSVETDKKDSADFALWKKTEPGKVMEWDSPWGKGIPGWHIECSAMSMKYLGESFDIHAGGEDLIFPHHEDEIAQSEAFSGKKFVKYWVHTNYLLADGEKMSRSKRNVFTFADLAKKGFDPLAYRYLTFMTHYRSRMNFTWKALNAARQTLERLYETASEFPEPQIGCAEFEQEFLDAINQDLNMPKAISVVWDLLKSKYPAHAKAASLYKFDAVLGLKIKEHAEAGKNIPEEIQDLAKRRESLRKEKRFGLADQMRAKIEKKGYIVKDSGEETKVIRKV